MPGLTRRPPSPFDVVRHVLAIAVEGGGQGVGAGHHAAAIGAAAGASEGRHGLVAEGGVVEGDLVAAGDGPARYHVETAQPSIRVAGVVDGLPVLRAFAPHHPDLLGQGIGVGGEPGLLQIAPMAFHMGAADQNMRLFLESLDEIAGDKIAGGVEAVPAVAAELQIPGRGVASPLRRLEDQR